MEVSKKVIVTNRSALKALYGDGIDLIDANLETLISSDQRRSIATTVVNLDDKEQMDKLEAPVVAGPGDERGNKEAIDAVFSALEPDYLVLLGGPDIIPHQHLDNPMTGGDDDDPDVPSDLPYACDSGYSLDPSDFLGPGRVVGRICGITGNASTDSIIAALHTASAWESGPRYKFDNYLAVSAQVWEGSTRTSVNNIFNNTDSLHLSPPDGPDWADEELRVRGFFVNCHGADTDARWYGQRGGNYPVAFASPKLTDKLIWGTVTAAECCYGAQLYSGGTMPICNNFLFQDGYGFVGSTNIAYGPAAGQGQADLITQYFMQNVLAGASTGRAMLEARQKFIEQAAPLHDSNLKTIAQFILLGDPSIQPVDLTREIPKSMKASFKPETLDVGERSKRRSRLKIKGECLGQGTSYCVPDQDLKPWDDLARVIAELVDKLQLESHHTRSYRVQGGPTYRKSMAKQPDEVFHVVYGKQGQLPWGPNFVHLVFHERNGSLISVEEIFRK